jgi:hypothetical protein
MSRQTQGRRWSTLLRRKKAALMTENGITPEEARTAVNAIVLQTGHTVERVSGYEPKSDTFTVCVRDSDKKLSDMVIYGETVARTVKAARKLCDYALPWHRVRSDILKYNRGLH